MTQLLGVAETAVASLGLVSVLHSQLRHSDGNFTVQRFWDGRKFPDSATAMLYYVEKHDCPGSCWHFFWAAVDT